jgi:hypothetical protein
MLFFLKLGCQSLILFSMRYLYLKMAKILGYFFFQGNLNIELIDFEINPIINLILLNEQFGDFHVFSHL